jgi:hypothetical protein
MESSLLGVAGKVPGLTGGGAGVPFCDQRHEAANSTKDRGQHLGCRVFELRSKVNLHSLQPRCATRFEGALVGRATRLAPLTVALEETGRPSTKPPTKAGYKASLPQSAQASMGDFVRRLNRAGLLRSAGQSRRGLGPSAASRRGHSCPPRHRSLQAFESKASNDVTSWNNDPNMSKSEHPR